MTIYTSETPKIQPNADTNNRDLDNRDLNRPIGFIECCFFLFLSLVFCLFLRGMVFIAFVSNRASYAKCGYFMMTWV